MALSQAALPLLRRLDPETAHRIGIAALRAGIAGSDRIPDPPSLAIEAFGRRLANPIGLAAGFDKDAAALHGLARLGFGFLEAGTVTPLPQLGNPRPRMFRLAEDRAVINRMGFNNHGIDGFVTNLKAAPRDRLPIGANIGINKEGADPLRDYPALAAKVAPHAAYIAINISSPNTPGLRDLQSVTRLGEILRAIERQAVAAPLYVKLAPDLDDTALADLVALCMTSGVAGLIIGNTTLARNGLRSRHRNEAGGLSGVPLFARSTRMLARAFLQSQGRLTLIGTGGVFTPEDVLMKLRAGAALVQVYTSFAFHGPALIPRLKQGLAALLAQANVSRLGGIIGQDAAQLAEQSQ
jgi:dihydroorotate dehydrogenase